MSGIISLCSSSCIVLVSLGREVHIVPPMWSWEDGGRRNGSLGWYTVIPLVYSMEKVDEENDLWGESYTNFLLNRVLRNKDEEEMEWIPGVKGRIPFVHCVENSRVFRYAADQTLPVTVYSEIDN
jgi:hypothetical protein